VLVTGPNGVGKTNLLESLHVGTQGFSPRTRMDAQLVRSGAEQAAVRLKGTRAGVETEVELTLGLHAARRVRLNGATLASAEVLRERIATLVFTPDRLSVVKGGPAVRRAYLDRTLARLLPARARVPLDYGAALGQRNTLLRRIAAGVAARDAMGPWTAQVASLGAALVSTRHETVLLLQSGFAAAAGELGLAGARLVYDAEPPTPEQLEQRLDRDLERGSTGMGPHLDEVGIHAGNRDLRTFGSQGEQRIAVLALLLAEAELLTDRGDAAPLLLLDDVLSELDRDRRRSLADRVARVPQVMVTATSADALPTLPAQLLEVRPGQVEDTR
jgi:DNA replication and repair protein RecF